MNRKRLIACVLIGLIYFSIPLISSADKIEDRNKINSLITKLNDSDPVVRGKAVRELAKFRDPLIIKPLRDAIKDPDAEVRENVLEAVFNVSCPVSVDIFKLAIKDKNVSVRTRAISLISGMWAGNKIPFTLDLIAALNDDSSQVKIKALWALNDVRDPRKIEPVISLLSDKDAQVRKFAVRELTTNDSNRYVELLIKCLEDESMEVWAEAVKCLTYIKRIDVIKPPQAVLKGKDIKLSPMLATVVLDGARDPRFVEPLIKLLKDETYYVRADAARALGMLDDQRAVEPLKELLKDTNGNVRERAAGALWKINPQAAEPLISPIVITIYPV